MTYLTNTDQTLKLMLPVKQ